MPRESTLVAKHCEEMISKNGRRAYCGNTVRVKANAINVRCHLHAETKQERRRRWGRAVASFFKKSAKELGATAAGGVATVSPYGAVGANATYAYMQ